MKIWIICCGEREGVWPQRCDAAAFTACARRAAEEAPEPRQERKMKAGEETVLLAPTAAARRTAELCVEGGALREEPLLAPVLQTAEGKGEHSPRFWRLRAGWQRRREDGGQPESQKQIRARAERLLTRLLEEEKDCTLIADCLLAEELMDAARRLGCARARTGIFRCRPWERILITRRDMHCGGCGHNCLLSNPGCGIGRDKAARKSK